jgi:hypothetical protein
VVKASQGAKRRHGFVFVIFVFIVVVVVVVIVFVFQLNFVPRTSLYSYKQIYNIIMKLLNM